MPGHSTRLAGTAARHGSIHPVEDVGGLHRRVRTERQRRAISEQRAPRIRVLVAAPPVALSNIAIAGGVDGLHGGDHPQSGQARQVVGMEELYVFDAVPGAQPRRRAGVSFVGVEHPSVGAVADGVDGAPEPAGDRAFYEVSEFLPRVDGDPGIPRLTVKWFQHAGSLRPQGAIGEDLHRSDAQPLIPKTGAQTGPGGSVQGLDRQGSPHPEFQDSARVKPLIRGKCWCAFIAFCTDKTVNADDSQPMQRFRRGEDALLDCLVINRGHHLPHQLLRFFLDETVRLAARVTGDFPAGRIWCPLINASQAQRGRIHPQQVAVPAAQGDGMLGTDRIEIVFCVESLLGPRVLVPPPVPDGERFNQRGGWLECINLAVDEQNSFHGLPGLLSLHSPLSLQSESFSLGTVSVDREDRGDWKDYQAVRSPIHSYRWTRTRL